MSRIVSGETKTVSSDILIGVAKEFKVSTDYILGLSTLSVRKSYDISELGLSEGAVRGLVTGTVDVQILNRLLEHRNFPKLMDLIRIYFQDTAAKGIMARNQLIELATVSLSDLMKEHPEHRAEARQDLQLLNAQKTVSYTHLTGENRTGGRYDELRQKAREWYPQCEEVACWSAQDCITPDSVPYIGRYAAGLSLIHI